MAEDKKQLQAVGTSLGGKGSDNADTTQAGENARNMAAILINISSRICDLGDLNEKLQKETEELKENVTAVESKIAEQGSESSKKNVAIRNLKTELNGTIKILEKKETKIKELEINIDKLKKMLKECEENDKPKKHRNQDKLLESLRSKLASMTEHSAELESIIKQQHAKIDYLLKHNECLQSEIVDVKFKMESEMGDMKSEMGGMKSEMSGMKSEIGGMKSEMSGMKSEMGGMKSEMGGMKSAMSDMKSVMSDMNSKMGDMLKIFKESSNPAVISSKDDIKTKPYKEKPMMEAGASRQTHRHDCTQDKNKRPSRGPNRVKTTSKYRSLPPITK